MKYKTHEKQEHGGIEMRDGLPTESIPGSVGKTEAAVPLKIKKGPGFILLFRHKMEARRNHCLMIPFKESFPIKPSGQKHPDTHVACSIHTV
jgi:hypothetical protein